MHLQTPHQLELLDHRVARASSATLARLSRSRVDVKALCREASFAPINSAVSSSLNLYPALLGHRPPATRPFFSRVRRMIAQLEQSSTPLKDQAKNFALSETGTDASCPIPRRHIPLQWTTNQDPHGRDNIHHTSLAKDQPSNRESSPLTAARILLPTVPRALVSRICDGSAVARGSVDLGSADDDAARVGWRLRKAETRRQRLRGASSDARILPVDAVAARLRRESVVSAANLEDPRLKLVRPRQTTENWKESFEDQSATTSVVRSSPMRPSVSLLDDTSLESFRNRATRLRAQAEEETRVYLAAKRASQRLGVVVCVAPLDLFSLLENRWPPKPIPYTLGTTQTENNSQRLRSPH